MENPGLFLKAVQSREEEAADKRLSAGPEGAWYHDLRVVSSILSRLTGQVPTLFAPGQDGAERERLAQAFAPAKTPFERLNQVGGRDR